MAKNMSEAMSLLSKNGFKLESVTYYKKMKYNIRHKYKPIVYVPIVGIDDSVSFMLDTGQKSVITLDGYECDVKSVDVRNIIKCEDEVNEIYGMTWYKFVAFWNNAMDNMRSLDFFRMEIEKIEK